jgi:hypothetical protein
MWRTRRFLLGRGGGVGESEDGKRGRRSEAPQTQQAYLPFAPFTTLSSFAGSVSTTLCSCLDVLSPSIFPLRSTRIDEIARNRDSTPWPDRALHSPRRIPWACTPQLSSASSSSDPLGVSPPDTLYRFESPPSEPARLWLMAGFLNPDDVEGEKQAEMSISPLSFFFTPEPDSPSDSSAPVPSPSRKLVELQSSLPRRPPMSSRLLSTRTRRGVRQSALG